MRTTLLAIGICCVSVGSAASAQTPQVSTTSGIPVQLTQTGTPAQTTTPAQTPTPPADTSPAAQTAGQGQAATTSDPSPQGTPPQTTPASQPAPAAAPEAPATTTGGFDFGGRGTHITGDVARYNRFRDLSDGLFFDNFSTQIHKSGWYYDFSGTHAGRQDAQYAGEVSMPGRLTFTGSYQAVPWNISSAATTKTIFLGTGTGVLTIPDYVQSLLQTNSANISQVVPDNLTPIALEAHRKYSQGGVEFMFDPNTTFTANVLHMDRGGTIVGEGTFGFSSAQELPVPVVQHQTDANFGAERVKGDWLFRVGYLASWFSNDDQSLTWDNPYRLTDINTLSSRGREALAPNSFMQTFSGTAAVKLAHKSRLVGTVSFGTLSDDLTFLPETINTAMPTFTLDRNTLQGSAHTTSANLIFTSHPLRNVDFDVRYRYYNYDGLTPSATQLIGRIEYDSTIESPPGTESMSNALDLKTQTFDAAATVDVRHGSLGFGYTHDGSDFNERIFEGYGMNTIRVTYDTLSTSWLDLHARYSYSNRRGSGFNNSDQVADGEQPTLQQFDIADRNENVATLTASFLFHTNYSLNVGAGGGKDTYPTNQDPTSGFGLQNASFTTYSVGIAGTPTENLSFTLSYDRNGYTTDQQSRSASPGVQFTDPTRNWTANGDDVVHSVLGDVDVKHVLIEKLGLKGTLNVNKGSTLYLYGLAPSSTLAAVSQLPAVNSQLTRVTIDLHYSLTERATIGFGYWFEKFTVNDFAMGGPALAPYAIPSLLTLGNAILPYTANTFFARLLYHW